MLFFQVFYFSIVFFFGLGSQKGRPKMHSSTQGGMEDEGVKKDLIKEKSETWNKEEQN